MSSYILIVLIVWLSVGCSLDATLLDIPELNSQSPVENPGEIPEETVKVPAGSIDAGFVDQSLPTSLNKTMARPPSRGPGAGLAPCCRSSWCASSGAMPPAPGPWVASRGSSLYSVCASSGGGSFLPLATCTGGTGAAAAASRANMRGTLCTGSGVQASWRCRHAWRQGWRQREAPPVPGRGRSGHNPRPAGCRLPVPLQRPAWHPRWRRRSAGSAASAGAAGSRRNGCTFQ